jgi:transcriptional regulator with XRE-family HTH domain
MIAGMPRRPRRTTQTHPLRQWREARGLTQDELAAQVGITQGMVSHIELFFRIPLGEALESLRAYTGLPTDAFIRPEAFLREEPDFLEKYRPEGKGRRRPRE